MYGGGVMQMSSEVPLVDVLDWSWSVAVPKGSGSSGSFRCTVERLAAVFLK